MNLNYSPEAEADLRHIHDHIAEADPAAADRVIARILQGMAVLEAFPMVGRPGRIEGTREWSLTGLPYVGVYAIADATEIDIIAIVHTSRQWP